MAERDRVFDDLRKREIGVQVHYVPTYRFSSFAGTGDPADFPSDRGRVRPPRVPADPPGAHERRAGDGDLERAGGALMALVGDPATRAHSLDMSTDWWSAPDA